MKESARIVEIIPENRKESRSSRIRNADNSRSSGSLADRVMFLQRTIGNQAVEKLLRSGTLQAKLRIGQPGDKYEQEADRVADQVMRMPEPQIVSGNNLHIQRACPGCEENELKRQPVEEEEEEKILAKTASDLNPEVDPGIENQIQSIKGGGRPLSEGERTFFEPRFGTDFSQVRVHTDAQASEVARGVNARAFTMGHDVVFGNGEYAPGTGEGRRLLGHELTHVIQQKNTAMFTNTEQNRQNGFIAQSFENETESNSRAIKSSDPLVNMPTSNKSIMRMPPEHTSSSSSLPYDTTYGPSTSFSDRVQFLQRTIGSQSVERMIRSGTLQAKLRIGQLGDEYEQEADRVAEQVTNNAPNSNAAPIIQREGGAAANPASHRFSSEGVSVFVRSSCAPVAFGFASVEDATNTALNAIFNTDCIEESRRTRIQRNLTANGLDIRCRRSANLENPGACAEATGYYRPANIFTLGSRSFAGHPTDSFAGCQPLESTILHEIVHLTRGFPEEALPSSCEASCFGLGGSPDLCKNITVSGRRTAGP